MTVAERPPPSFMRRHLAANSNDSDVLVGLACDDNMWVRREAATNPATPAWVLGLLHRAGAAPDLRGRGDPDPDMPPAELRRLVECGPWAQQLVSDHPNTTAEVLHALVRHPAGRVRASVARHPNAGPDTLAILFADADDVIRRTAAAHERRPDDVLALMERTGALPDLSGVREAVDDQLGPDELSRIADLGEWGRFLAARHPACPADVLALAATDPDWRVRSAVLDNPSTPDEMLAAVAGLDDGAGPAELRPLSDRTPSPDDLPPLVQHPQAEVRLALGRHPATTAALIGELAVDRVAEIRRAAATHHLMDPDLRSLLVRAGSTPDLGRLAEPDPSITAVELDELAGGGYWARQLAVRHPETAPPTLGRLLCDADPKLREWAAAHPAVPADVVDLLRRAGAADDFQGIAEPDPQMSSAELSEVEALGPYGAWVVSWHPSRAEPDRRSSFG